MGPRDSPSSKFGEHVRETQLVAGARALICLDLVSLSLFAPRRRARAVNSKSEEIREGFLIVARSATK